MFQTTLKGCIFDLDGTLLNTIADLGLACNYALQYFGYPTHTMDEYPHLVGNGVNRLIERALPDGHKDETTVLRLREVFVPYYDMHNCVHTVPYLGINEVLQTLRQCEVRMAVASNKYQAATTKLVNHFFPNTFDAVLGERPNTPRKPNPQIVYDILSMWDNTAEKNDCLYVGDSLVDVETARNAHLPIVACAWGFCAEQELAAAKPDYLIRKPSDILTMLDR